MVSFVDGGDQEEEELKKNQGLGIPESDHQVMA